jgi:hypothetical protein
LKAVLDYDLLVDADVYVIPCVRLGGNVAFSSSPSERFENFISPFHRHRAPAPGIRPVVKRQKLDDEQRDKLLAENDWLSDDDLPRQMQEPRASRGRGGGHAAKPPNKAADSDGDDDEEEPIPEDFDLVPIDFDQVAAELADIRKVYADELERDNEYFHVHFRGGKWTKAVKDVATDCVAGYARAGIARDWCDGFAFPKSKSFSYKKYGRAEAITLAFEFCRRGSFFINQWVDAGGEGFGYSRAHIDLYVESEAWIAFMFSLADGHLAFDKGMQMRDIFPECD